VGPYQWKIQHSSHEYFLYFSISIQKQGGIYIIVGYGVGEVGVTGAAASIFGSNLTLFGFFF
jgi:hypothetical protein